MINLTDSAVAEISKMMHDRGLAEAVVRFGVESGGCSGLQYSMDFDDQVRSDDTVFDTGGLKIVCDGKSLTFLDGLKVDFSTKLMGGGFKFENPNAAKSCGCGTSFRV
jgi:iron-sulfur cluster assembly protein